MTQTTPWCCVACMASLLASDSCMSACASSEKSCRWALSGLCRDLLLCCAVPCHAVLCRAALCCAVPCRAVLCCAVLCCAVLCCAVLCCALLYCIVPCSGALPCPDLPSPALLYPDLPCPALPCPACPTLCCAVLCCAVLYIVGHAAPSHSHQVTSLHLYHVTGKITMPIHFWCLHARSFKARSKQNGQPECNSFPLTAVLVATLADNAIPPFVPSFTFTSASSACIQM